MFFGRHWPLSRTQVTAVAPPFELRAIELRLIAWIMPLSASIVRHFVSAACAVAAAAQATNSISAATLVIALADVMEETEMVSIDLIIANLDVKHISMYTLN